MNKIENLFLLNSKIKINKVFFINKFKIKKIELNHKINNSKYSIEFEDETIKKIKKLKLDLIIRLGSKILKGKILDCSRSGIISFHHGDNKFFRGGPAGFWEVYYGRNDTGFIIQKLSNKLDAGDVIYKGSFKTKPYFLANQVDVRYRSIYYLKKVLKIYEKNRKFKFLKKYKVSKKIFKNPNFLQVINY